MGFLWTLVQAVNRCHSEALSSVRESFPGYTRYDREGESFLEIITFKSAQILISSFIFCKILCLLLPYKVLFLKDYLQINFFKC